MQPISHDGLQAETQQHLPELIKGCEAVIHIATAIPANLSEPSAWETTTRLRTEGTRVLLAASLQAGATCYLQQSIVMAYPDSGDSRLDEDQPLDTAQARPWISGAVIEDELDRCLLTFRDIHLPGQGAFPCRNGDLSHAAYEIPPPSLVEPASGNERLRGESDEW